MKTIQDVVLGEKINHPTRGEGIIIGKTKRTLTAKFKYSTVKNSYYKNNTPFNEKEF